MLFNVTRECVQVACLLAFCFSRSCFELLLSIPESELPHEVWLGFHQSIQVSVMNFFFAIYILKKKKKKAAVIFRLFYPSPEFHLSCIAVT